MDFSGTEIRQKRAAENNENICGAAGRWSLSDYKRSCDNLLDVLFLDQDLQKGDMFEN